MLFRELCSAWKIREYKFPPQGSTKNVDKKGFPDRKIYFTLSSRLASVRELRWDPGVFVKMQTGVAKIKAKFNRGICIDWNSRTLLPIFCTEVYSLCYFSTFLPIVKYLILLVNTTLAFNKASLWILFYNLISASYYYS